MFMVEISQRGKEGTGSLEITLLQSPQGSSVVGSRLERVGPLWRYLGGGILLNGCRGSREEQGWQPGVWPGCWVDGNALYQDGKVREGPWFQGIMASSGLIQWERLRPSFSR